MLKSNVAVHARRHAAEADRRARDRHRDQAVRDGPRRCCTWRAADHGVPASDDQRQRQVGPKRGWAGQGDAGHHRGCEDHPAHRIRRRRRSPSAVRPSASASMRFARLRSTGLRGRSIGCPSRTCSRSLKATELPLTPKRLPVGKTIESVFTFNFRPGDPLETNCAIADVKPGSAEIWSSLEVADLGPGAALGRSSDDAGFFEIKLHVAQGGGLRSGATCSATPRSRPPRSRRRSASR